MNRRSNAKYCFKLIYIFLMILLVYSAYSLNYTHPYDAIYYVFNTNGTIEIYNQNTDELEGILGTSISSDEKFIDVTDYFWTWSTAPTPTNSIERIKGTNNDTNIIWTKHFDYYENIPTKIKDELTNNDTNLTNVKFWYWNKVNSTAIVRFNDSTAVVSNNNLSISSGIGNISSDIHFRNYRFSYNDVIDNGFEILNVTIGDGVMIDSSYENDYLVGISIDGGNFSIGEDWTIDPEATGYKSPVNTGDPLNQWANGQYIISSNNQYASEGTIGHQLDTSNYSFTFPVNGSTINGIACQVEGKSGGPFCAGKASEGTVTVDLSWDGGSTYTSGLNNTWSCPTESTQTYGNSSYTWGRTWSTDDLSNESFRVRVTLAADPLADQFFADHIQCQVWYTEPNIAPNITINSPTNYTTLTIYPVELNFTVTDFNNHNSSVTVHASNSTTTLNEFVIYRNHSVLNGSTILTNLTMLPYFRDDKTAFLVHLDNNTLFGEGSSVNDFSVYDNDGGIDGDPEFVSGYVGGGFEFDGPGGGDSLDFGDITNLDGLKEVSFGAWVNTKNNQYQTIIGKYKASGDNRVFLFRLINGSTYPRVRVQFFRLGSGTNWVRWDTDDDVIPLNEWTHVVASVNLSYSTAVIYVNGSSVPSTRSTSGVWATQIYDEAANLCVSGFLCSGTALSSFNGTLDEVIIWNATLSSDEVSAVYNNNITSDHYYWNVTADDGTDTGSNESEFFLELCDNNGCDINCSNNPVYNNNIDLLGTALTFYESGSITFNANITNASAIERSDIYDGNICTLGFTRGTFHDIIS